MLSVIIDAFKIFNFAAYSLFQKNFLPLSRLAIAISLLVYKYQGTYISQFMFLDKYSVTH